MERSKNSATNHRVNILAIIQSDGFQYKKVATTHGGEYAGACPWCGGNDRFLVWPEHKGGRYWCRGCGKTGDAVQYARETRNLSYFEALDFLGIEKQQLNKTKRRHTGPPPFIPKAESLPPPSWIEKATKLLKWSQEQLWTPGGQAAREILSGKGLNEETIRTAGIGWNPGEQGKDLYRDRRGWGLSPEFHRDGRLKKLWLPQGLVIYEKVFQIKAHLNIYCFSEAKRLEISRSFRKTRTHILLIAVPDYGFVPVIYPRYFCAR